MKKNNNENYLVLVEIKLIENNSHSNSEQVLIDDTANDWFYSLPSSFMSYAIPTKIFLIDNKDKFLNLKLISKLSKTVAQAFG